MPMPVHWIRCRHLFEDGNDMEGEIAFPNALNCMDLETTKLLDLRVSF